MKYWTCWDLENIRMLWMLLVYLDSRWDEIRTMLAWMKEDLPWTAVCFDSYETMVSVLNNEMNPLSIFLRMKPGRFIHTNGSTRHGSFFSLYPIKKIGAPKSSQWFFCWRCAFCMNTFLTIPRTQREELDRYDVRSRDQTREILGADQEARWRSQEGPDHGRFGSGVCRTFLHGWKMGPYYMGVPKIGVPQNGWFMIENPIKNGWFGGTTIFGNPHILN